MRRLWERYGSTAGKTVCLFVALTAVAVLARYLPGIDEQALALAIRDKGAGGVLAYIGIAAIGSALGIPRQALSFAGGYAYGALLGVLFATFGTILGCATAFFLARTFGRPYLPTRLAGRMRSLDAFVAESPFTMTLTVRLLPFGNNALTNLLAGFSSIPATGFIAGSFFGYIPQNFIFALLGSGMRVDPFWRVCAASLLFLAALGMGVFLFRKHRSFVPESEKKH